MRFWHLIRSTCSMVHRQTVPRIDQWIILSGMRVAYEILPTLLDY